MTKDQICGCGNFASFKKRVNDTCAALDPV